MELLSSLVNSALSSKPIKENASNRVLQRLGVKCPEQEISKLMKKLVSSRKICYEAEVNVFEKEFDVWMAKLTSPNMLPGTRCFIIKASLMCASRGHTSKNLSIEAVRLFESDNIEWQCLGGLFLTRQECPGSHALLLIVNLSIQRLSSSNIFSKCHSFNILPSLISSPGISRSYAHISEALDHCQPLIRRKSARCLIALCQTNCEEDFTVIFVPKLIVLLMDNDFSVRIAAVQALTAILKNSPMLTNNMAIRNTIGEACSYTLRQCVSGNAPSHYDMAGSKAPFVQVQILKLLSALRHNSWQAPESVLIVLKDVLNQKPQDPNYVICMALLEAIFTVCAIASKTHLITHALNTLMEMLGSCVDDIRSISLRACAKSFSYIEDIFTTSQLKAVLKLLTADSIQNRSHALQLLSVMANKENYKTVCITLDDCAEKADSVTIKEKAQSYISSVILAHCTDIKWLFEYTFQRKKYFPENLLEFVVEEIEKLSDPAKSTILKLCEDSVDEITGLSQLTYNHFITGATLLNICESQVKMETLVKFIDRFLAFDEFTHCHPAVIRCIVMYGKHNYQSSIFILKRLRDHMNPKKILGIQHAIEEVNSNLKYPLQDIEQAEYSFSFLDDVIDSCEPVWISDPIACSSLISSDSECSANFEESALSVSWSPAGRCVKSKSVSREDIEPFIEVADEANEEKILQLEREEELAKQLYKGFKQSMT